MESQKIKSICIIVDFDGTCVTHDFPKIGRDIGAAEVLKKLVDAGHQLILFTMRCNHTFNPSSNQPDVIAKRGNYLSDAISWFEENNIDLYGIQTNPSQHSWTSSPKAYGHLIIDDTALGCPLIYGKHERPYVDWVEVERMLIEKRIL